MKVFISFIILSFVTLLALIYFVRARHLELYTDAKKVAAPVAKHVAAPVAKQVTPVAKQVSAPVAKQVVAKPVPAPVAKQVALVAKPVPAPVAKQIAVQTGGNVPQSVPKTTQAPANISKSVVPSQNNKIVTKQSIPSQQTSVFGLMSSIFPKWTSLF